MSLLLLSFIAGILTVLAPCAFMLLPVIIGGSAGDDNKYRPYIITLSLALSLFIFTILLKATSLLINIDPTFLTYFSGVTVIFLGLISLFPKRWDAISLRFKLSSTSDNFLHDAKNQKGLLGAILTGVALGPVFSACSPTYVYILTTVLRQNFVDGLINMFAYIFGLGIIMLGAGLLGQRFIKKLRWAVNPQGIFKKVIAVIFIVVGIAIITGLDKQLQSNFSPLSPVNQLEQNLLSKALPQKSSNNNGQLLNVVPPTPAPEIQGIDTWINSNGESLSKLKGKVVLVDFWTYSCINCVRSAPYINKWYDTYKDNDFVVLGLHAPEFAFEKNKENVEKAVRDTYKIQYPVGLDNDFKTWDAYKNQFWPAKYLIDKDGNLRYTHFGEGEYDKTEEAIRQLLTENGKKLESGLVTSKDTTDTTYPNITPETYLGWSRSEKFMNRSQLIGKENKLVDYAKLDSLNSDSWTLDGNWTVNSESIIAGTDSKLRLKFNASQVFIVGGSEQEAKMQIKITNSNNEDITSQISGDDVKNGVVTVQADKLYKLVKSDKNLADATVELSVPKDVRLNVFTFG